MLKDFFYSLSFILFREATKNRLGIHKLLLSYFFLLLFGFCTIKVFLIPTPFFLVVLSLLFGYYFADLTTGVYRWMLDNYSFRGIPILENQALELQEHYDYPQLITKETALNVIASTTPIGIIILSLSLFFSSYLFIFTTSFVGFIVFSQQIHRLAHKRGKKSKIIKLLRKYKIILDSKEHLTHHKKPFNKHYATVSGRTNKLLDKYKVYEKLEGIIFKLTKIKPNNWNK